MSGQILRFPQAGRPGRRLPPYSNQLDAGRPGSIAIVTGGAGWERMGTAPGWFAGKRLLLPFGADPGRYAWPVAGFDCIVYGFGASEPRGNLLALSAGLVRAGALFAIWGGQFETCGERRLAGPLSELPAPIFRAGRAAA